MGEHSEFRVKVFSTGFGEICNFLSQKTPAIGTRAFLIVYAYALTI